MTAPPVVVLRILPEAMLEIAREVVIAFVVVEFPVTFRLPLIVVEPTETMPLLNVSVVDVALLGNKYEKFV